MTQKANVLVTGGTRGGKTLSSARAILDATDEAAVIFEPHKDSLGREVLTHAIRNVLHDNLSDIELSLGYDLLTPSMNPNPLKRQAENQRRAEAFVEILLRRRGSDGLAGTPLMEEWVMAAIQLWMFQGTPKPL